MNDLPTIAYITAGAAGMYCGSCMHDNTMAQALHAQGVDVQLIPTYTPIRTDERDISVDQVFFGGINVFLQQKIPLFRHLPRVLDRVLDRPWFIRWATSGSLDVSPKELGSLTVSMLRGTSGYQKKEVKRLCDWLIDSVKPDALILSNILIGGFLPALRRRLETPIFVTLQGDDIFLEELPEPYKSRAFQEIRRLVGEVDGFLVHSRYYADFMADYFSIPPSRFHIIPLGIDLADFQSFLSDSESPPDGARQTIGYLARLAPEKGLHLLAEAFIELHQKYDLKESRLRIAGWLGPHHHKYRDEILAQLRRAGLEHACDYVGEVDRAGKLQFLREIDVLSVPTIYHEPKGLFVLEALAAGVPVVQPEHGAFPELLAAVGGGRLVTPGDASRLAAGLAELLQDSAGRRRLGRDGQEAVHRQYSAAKMAQQLLDVLRPFTS